MPAQAIRRRRLGLVADMRDMRAGSSVGSAQAKGERDASRIGRRRRNPERTGPPLEREEKKDGTQQRRIVGIVMHASAARRAAGQEVCTRVFGSGVDTAAAPVQVPRTAQVGHSVAAVYERHRLPRHLHPALHTTKKKKPSAEIHEHDRRRAKTYRTAKRETALDQFLHTRPEPAGKQIRKSERARSFANEKHNKIKTKRKTREEMKQKTKQIERDCEQRQKKIKTCK